MNGTFSVKKPIQSKVNSTNSDLVNLHSTHEVIDGFAGIWTGNAMILGKVYLYGKYERVALRKTGSNNKSGIMVTTFI